MLLSAERLADDDVVVDDNLRDCESPADDGAVPHADAGLLQRCSERRRDLLDLEKSTDAAE
jgi:hypothetical protein